MPSPAVIDLYAIRGSVATLVYARDNISALDHTWLPRIDTVIAYLGTLADQHGDIATYSAQLLDPTPDPAGRRTLHAIHRLAQLTHVDTRSAPALAAAITAERA